MFRHINGRLIPNSIVIVKRPRISKIVSDARLARYEEIRERFSIEVDRDVHSENNEY